MSGQAPYGYPGPHHRPSIHHSLQPEQVSGYTSLAQWHGGRPPPVFPPRGEPVPPPPTSNRDHRIPVPPSRGGTRSPTRWLRDGGLTIDPSTYKWPCDCGRSFSEPRERERHWHMFKCGGDGSSEPRPAETFVIPARSAARGHHHQEVDKKWLPVLLKVFGDDASPSWEIRTELAWSMRVPLYAVDTWFMLHRQAQKEQQKQK